MRTTCLIDGAQKQTYFAYACRNQASRRASERLAPNATETNHSARYNVPPHLQASQFDASPWRSQAVIQAVCRQMGEIGSFGYLHTSR